MDKKRRTFTESVVELYPWMYSTARRFFKNKADIDDLVSETMLRLLANSDKFDSSYDLKPWCLTVMRNIHANWYQRSNIITWDSYDDSYTASVNDNYDYLELSRMLEKYARVSLNVHCLELYVMGYSYEEISSRLQIKVGTVRSRIYNGRKVLKMAIRQ